MTSPFLAIVHRDLRLAVRQGGGAGLGLIFFFMIVVLIPFAVGPNPNLLARIAPAILWTAALLATLIGLDRMFQADEEDGSLDHLRAGALPLELVALAKIFAHWLVSGLPLALIAPALGVLLALPVDGMLPLSLTLLVGAPALTAIGAVGAALTARIRRGGVLASILVLPLMLPTLIFGVSAAQAALGGTIPFRAPFFVLCAISLVGLVVGAFASAAALRTGD